MMIDSLCPFGRGAGLPFVPGSGFIPFPDGILLEFDGIGVADEVVEGRIVPQAGRQSSRSRSRSSAKNERIYLFPSDVFIILPRMKEQHLQTRITIWKTLASGKRFPQAR